MLEYRNIEKEPDKYFYLHKLGKMNFDLISCVKLMEANIRDSESINYLSQVAYIHINEVLKYLARNKTIAIEEYLTSEFKKTDHYKIFCIESNLDNNESSNNSYIKNFRDRSLHYRYNGANEKALFLKYARELRSYFPEIEKEFSRENNIEQKSMMIHLNMNITENAVSQEEYSKILIGIIKSLIALIKQLQDALLKELDEV